MKLILSILVFLSLQSHGQIINASPLYRPFASAPSCSYLLDQYSGAAAAYSLRKLDCDYAGSAIRVRESGGNTESDIGFTANGDLDTASLKTFVGANDGSVVTWYDQSGNTRDLTQSTSTNQPKIIKSGIIYRNNGDVSVYFYYPDHQALALTFTQFSTTSHSLFLVYSISGSSSAYPRPTSFCSSSSNDFQVYSPAIYISTSLTSIGAYVSAGAQAMVTVSASTQYVYSAIHTGSQIKNSVNAGTEQTYNHTLNSNIKRYTIGCAAYSNDTFIDWMNGYVTEVIYYNADQTSNKSSILSNINSYYSIY